MRFKSKRLPVILTLSIAAALIAIGVISQSMRASATRTVTTRQRVVGTPAKHQPQLSPKEEFEKLKRQFPKVDYDAAEPSDSNERKKRQEKGKRFDKLGGVSHEPTRYSSGLRNHWEINLPALPVAESNAVVIARTLSRAAYLSHDKGAVFTELCIHIDEVLKSTDDSLQKDSRIDINRLGGVVRYRTGEESLLFVNGQNMPAEGKRYLFFLKAIPNSHDFTIITGYELGTSSVTPLDTPPQFAQFDGVDPSGFLDTVRRAVLEQNK